MYVQLVKVVLDDGTGSSKSYTAKLIGTDAMHDLAVLSVSPSRTSRYQLRVTLHSTGSATSHLPARSLTINMIVLVLVRYRTHCILPAEPQMVHLFTTIIQLALVMISFTYGSRPDHFCLIALHSNLW